VIAFASLTTNASLTDAELSVLYTYVIRDHEAMVGALNRKRVEHEWATAV
jgi:hypothetical protein